MGRRATRGHEQTLAYFGLLTGLPPERLEQHPLRRVLEEFPDRTISIHLPPGSPWIEIDVDPAYGEEATDDNAGRQYAIWKNTDRLYGLTAGAAHDDPIPDDATLRDHAAPVDRS